MNCFHVHGFDERLKQHRDNVRLAERELYMGTEMSKLRAEQRMKGIGGGLVTGLYNRPAFFKKWLFSNFNKGYQYVNSMQFILKLYAIHTYSKKDTF